MEEEIGSKAWEDQMELTRRLEGLPLYKWVEVELRRRGVSTVGGSRRLGRSWGFGRNLSWSPEVFNKLSFFLSLSFPSFDFSSLFDVLQKAKMVYVTKIYTSFGTPHVGGLGVSSTPLQKSVAYNTWMKQLRHNTKESNEVHQ